jgi:hypothetical protein
MFGGVRRSAPISSNGVREWCKHAARNHKYVGAPYEACPQEEGPLAKAEVDR